MIYLIYPNWERKKHKESENESHVHLFCLIGDRIFEMIVCLHLWNIRASCGLEQCHPPYTTADTMTGGDHNAIIVMTWQGGGPRAAHPLVNIYNPNVWWCHRLELLIYISLDASVCLFLIAMITIKYVMYSYVKVQLRNHITLID